LDLGEAPPSNAYLSAEDLDKPEKKYPLRVLVCTKCWLVRTEDFVGAEELFRPDYAYFSSTSNSWLVHAKEYCEMIVPKLCLSKNSFVVAVTCTDGYLSKDFVAAGIPCLDIEPTASTAAAAEKLGIPEKREFFTQKLAKFMAAAGQKPDLIIGNNVYAHVPDMNDFTKGLASLLKPEGVITLEFPHLLKLIKDCQFDTIYHEHFSYPSLHVVSSIFALAEKKIWQVEELPTHGGSLRVYGSLKSSKRTGDLSVGLMLKAESAAGLLKEQTYRNFQTRADKIKSDLLEFLRDCKKDGKRVAAYGAAAKGNTLLNYAGLKRDLLPYVCDAAPSKQGKFLPGSQIPILGPDELMLRRPDDLLVLPWNLIGEIRAQYDGIAQLGTRFVVAVPHLVTA
jgi:SAM-dependent methyltransferase